MVGSSPGPDAQADELYRTLRSDHDSITLAIDRLLAGDTGLDAPSLLATTLSAIEQHLALEEARLYPMLRTHLPHGESEVIRVMAHTALIEQRMATLRSPDLSPRQRARLLGDLRSLLDRHVERHESRHVLVQTQ